MDKVFTSLSTMISSASTIVDSLWAMNTDVLSLIISFMELKMFWKQRKTKKLTLCVLQVCPHIQIKTVLESHVRIFSKSNKIKRS